MPAHHRARPAAAPQSPLTDAIRQTLATSQALSHGRHRSAQLVREETSAIHHAVGELLEDAGLEKLSRDEVLIARRIAGEESDRLDRLATTLADFTHLSTYTYRKSCDACRGAAEVNGVVCWACHGEGLISYGAGRRVTEITGTA